MYVIGYLHINWHALAAAGIFSINGSLLVQIHVDNVYNMTHTHTHTSFGSWYLSSRILVMGGCREGQVRAMRRAR